MSGRENISKSEVAGRLSSIAETLELVLTFEDEKMVKDGIKGVINHCLKEANRLDSKFHPHKTL